MGPRYLIIGPGSTGFFAYLGFVTRYHNDGLFDDLAEISASSAGALLAFCYLIGRTRLDELREYIFNIDMKSALKFKIKNLLKNYGLIDSAIVRDEISKLCFHFSGQGDITFKRLFENTGVKLWIPAYTLNKCTNTYFSVDTDPDMSVIDAVCSTISIPLVFPPYHGKLDGSIIEEIPWIPFASYPPEQVLAIRITGETKGTETKSFFSYITNLINIIYSMRDKNKNINTIILDTGDLDIMNFSMNQDTKLITFLRGYNIVR